MQGILQFSPATSPSHLKSFTMIESIRLRWKLLFLLGPTLYGSANAFAIDDSPYTLADPALKAVVIDSSADESFLSVRADTQGRLFVGGREALFVYEPKAEGGYQPRREIFRFPKDSWINDIAIRGDDLYVATVPALYLLPGARLKRRRYSDGKALRVGAAECVGTSPE